MSQNSEHILDFGERVRGETIHEWKAANKRMNDVQMGVASDWVGLSASTLPTVAAQRLRRGVGFGGRVCGENRPRMKNHDDEWMARKWESASGWVGLSASTLPTVAAQRLRRVVGFGGRVRWVVNGWEADKRMDDSESLNPLTPHLRSVQVSAKYPLTTCADSGFRRACPWGKSRPRMKSANKRMVDVQMGVVSTGFRQAQPPAQPNGFGVGEAVCVTGKELTCPHFEVKLSCLQST